MYKANTIIVGPSGSGKSSCYEHLPDDKTVIIDTEQKGFPFRKKFSQVELPTNAVEFYTALTNAKNNPNVTYIVVDSLTKHFENCLAICRAGFKGFDIWSNYSLHVRRTLNELKSREKYIAAIAIDEFVEILSPEGTKTSARRAAVQGKENEGKLEKEFLIALFTDVRKDKDGKMCYRFMTNTDGICAAKSPAFMFTEQFVPNNLAGVFSKVEEYYK